MKNKKKLFTSSLSMTSTSTSTTTTNRQLVFNNQVFSLPDAIPDVDQYLHDVVGVPELFMIVKTQNPWETVEKKSLPNVNESVTVLTLHLNEKNDTMEQKRNQSSLFSIEYLLQQPEEKIWYFLTQNKAKADWQKQVDRFLNTCDSTTNLKLIQKFIDFLNWVRMTMTSNNKTNDLSSIKRRQVTDDCLIMILFQQWIIKMASISPTLPFHVQRQVEQLSHWVFDTLIDDVKYNDKGY
jgi:hypothetical protein